MDLLKSKGYTPFFIPAYCTGSLQFHDVYVNRTFKTARCLQWCMEADWKPSRPSVVRSVEKANSVLSTESIVAGFKKLVLRDSVIAGSKITKTHAPISLPKSSRFISEKIYRRYKHKQEKQADREEKKYEKQLLREQKRADRAERHAAKRAREESEVDEYQETLDFINSPNDFQEHDNPN